MSAAPQRRAQLLGDRAILAVVPAPAAYVRFQKAAPLPPELDAALARWRRWMHAQGASLSTIEHRMQIIGQWHRVTGCQPVRADAEDVVAFLATLGSVSHKVTTFAGLKAWFRWLMAAGVRDDEPTAMLRPPRLPRRRPRPVATGHLERLLATPMKSRTRTQILLAAYQGLRVHEIAKIRGEDLDLVSGRLRVVGKGGIDASLPLHPMIEAESTRYPRRGWWFPTYGGNSGTPRALRGGAAKAIGPCLPGSVGNNISRVMHRADVPGTAHSLRHWYGTELVRSGANLRVAQELLRHASLATTAIYTAVANEEMASALEALPVVDTSSVSSHGKASTGAAASDVMVNGQFVTVASIRAWGRQHGLEIGTREGRAPVALVRAYRTAHDAGPEPKSVTPDTIRAWGRENGWTLSDRGRLPAVVVTAYRAACSPV